jgi:glycosyltransferase involved in cell wall biosynthesis
VHAHDTYGILVQDLTLPRVFTVHGFIYKDTLLSGKKVPWLRSRIWEYVETKSWARQPNIISISPYVREHVSAIATGTIYDIENPIAARFFDVEREEQAQMIFSSAVISPRKNPIALIDAVRRLVGEGYNPSLRIAGGTVSQPYADQLEALIEREGLRSHVALLGRISAAQVMEELSRASVYALVSLEENAPMGIEEAMAAGIPVVTSNRCGMPYMVRNDATGYLVDPLNPDEIARRLRQLFDNDELRRRLGASAGAFAREWYHPESVARRTKSVYEDILARSDDPRKSA